MPTFFEKLKGRAKAIDSLLCISLDPPDDNLSTMQATDLESHCLRLVNATQSSALAFRLNTAFFEAFGSSGWAALENIISAIPAEIPIILDAKRGDLPTAGRSYAKSAFDTLGVDAITLNPYLGYDSITPFLNKPEKGVFLVCKTSNPGSVDLQDLTLGGHYRLMTVYEKIAGLATEWGAMNNIGLFVDEYIPDTIRRIRDLAPDQWLLVEGSDLKPPDLQDLMLAGLREDGLGMLICVKHEVCSAEDPGTAAQLLALRFREGQSTTRPTYISQKTPMDGIITPLVEGFLSMGCIRFGEFTLKSGAKTPIQIDLRHLISFPGWMTQVAAAYIRILRNLVFDRIAGLPYAALPITTAISLQANKPMIYPRKKLNEEEDEKTIEGIYHPGETVVLIDDLAITGQSCIDAIEQLTDAGLNVQDVLVLIDCELGAMERLWENGIKLHALFPLSNLLDYWEETQRLPCEQLTNVRNFLDQYRP